MVVRRYLDLSAVVVGSLLAGALYTWFSGEDINWDWRNYHEYGAFALLNGRFDTDVAPGGFQSFLNPLVYVPAYWLRHGLGAPFWGLLLGAIHGLNLALVFWITRLLLAAPGLGVGLAVLVSVVIAAFGPMTLSEVGTSFADVLTALPVLAAIGLIMSADERHAGHFLAAGLLIGAAVGLKLTNVTFLIGAVASLLALSRPLQKIGLFGLGSAIGGLATGGSWALMLLRRFGSPVFPYFNTIFLSPEAPIAPLADGRFLPNGLLNAMAYPFYWLIGDHPSSENAFRDPRFAVVIALLAAMIGIGLIRKTQIFRRRDHQFLLFFIVAYGLWLAMFAIHRYAVVLELMTAPMIVLLLTRFFETLHGPNASQMSQARNGAVVVVALAIVLWTRPADWSRRPWSEPYRPQLTGEFTTPATYILVEKPVGYIVPLLPAGSSAYQLADILLPILPGGVLDRRIREGLSHPPAGGIRALFLFGNPPRKDLLAAYDLEIDETRDCERIEGADDRDIAACPLIRKPQSSREHYSQQR